MEKNLSSWNTHVWMTRRLELAPGKPVMQLACIECERSLVEDYSTNERYAVHVSVFKLHRLSDEVTARWLSQKCPAKRKISDEADRQTRFIGESSRSTGEMANDRSDSGSSAALI